MRYKPTLMSRRKRKAEEAKLPWEGEEATPNQKILSGLGCGCGCLGIFVLIFAFGAAYFASMGLLADPSSSTIIGGSGMTSSCLCIFLGISMWSASWFVE